MVSRLQGVIHGKIIELEKEFYAAERHRMKSDG